jgi:hypothetical protein
MICLPVRCGFIRIAQSYILVLLPFQPDSYGPDVAEILSLGDARGGARPMDLFPRRCADEAVRARLDQSDALKLFSRARDPHAAFSGLYLYFSCLTKAHELVHMFESRDGMYWHAIMHRMEGDIGNARYWFHRIPAHPVFASLQREAEALGYDAPGQWDPFDFAAFCESAAGTANEDLAKRVQLAEWQLLFDYCAAPAVAAALGDRAAAI